MANSVSPTTDSSAFSAAAQGAAASREDSSEPAIALSWAIFTPLKRNQHSSNFSTGRRLFRPASAPAHALSRQISRNSYECAEWGIVSGLHNASLAETDAFFRKCGKVITPLTVEETLNDQIARKLLA